MHEEGGLPAPAGGVRRFHLNDLAIQVAHAALQRGSGYVEVLVVNSHGTLVLVRAAAGDGTHAHRGAHLRLTIARGGVFHQLQELSAKNNWAAPCRGGNLFNRRKV